MPKLLAFVLILSAICSAQQTKAACDKDMTFCWYSEEVIAQGNRWVSQDGKKVLEVSQTFRCVKSLNLCVRSRSYHQVLHENLIVTSIELMPITHWDN